MTGFLETISPAYAFSGFVVGFMVGLTGVGGGSLVHQFNRAIDWRIVGRLAAGSLPAALVTLTTFYFLGLDSTAVRGLITRVLGTALYATALALILRPLLLRLSARFEG